MNIKSLLLGSAAALAVVSGAQAADAIVAAAPEPMEYVKVCDAYGTGYFYIPGTETCLNISAKLRYQVDYNSAGFGANYAAAGSKWSSYANSKFRLEVNAKNDSEYGTVYSFIRIEGWDAWNTVGTGTRNGFYAGIGGFEAGYFDSAWTRFFGYGGFTDDGGRYAFMRSAYASYTANLGSAAIMASVDDLQTGSSYNKTYGLNAAAKATFGDYAAALGVAYDGLDKSAAVKGYVSGKFDVISLKLMGLYSASATNQYTGNIKGFTLLLGGKAQLTDKLFAAVDYSYSFDPKTWYLVGDIGWNVASGFDVLVEGKYDSGTKVKAGFLRLQRSF